MRDWFFPSSWLVFAYAYISFWAWFDYAAWWWLYHLQYGSKMGAQRYSKWLNFQNKLVKLSLIIHLIHVPGLDITLMDEIYDMYVLHLVTITFSVTYISCQQTLPWSVSTQLRFCRGLFISTMWEVGHLQQQLLNSYCGQKVTFHIVRNLVEKSCDRIQQNSMQFWINFKVRISSSVHCLLQLYTRGDTSWYTSV